MQLLYSQTTEEFENLRNGFLYTLLGNFEIVLAVSDDLDAKEEREVWEHINHIFELEGKSSNIEEMLESLKICLN